MADIWIAEDESALAEGLRRAFEKDGHRVITFGTLKSLLYSARSFSQVPQVIILDHKLPDGLGGDAIPQILSVIPHGRIILMTAYGESPLIVKAIRNGAFDYIDKPFSLEALRKMVQRALLRYSVEVAARDAAMGNAQLIGSSAPMMRLRDTVDRLKGQRDLNILLTGESGTGKEVVSRMIHEVTSCEGSFVAINCGAIPENLLEAELFGYKRGAYTGAADDKKGLLELGHGGTVMLDEIGDLPLSLQSKLLRFLDSRRFRRLGDTAEREVSLNLICATHKDLKEMSTQGLFREDLLYRISTIPIKVPPLRERGSDVIELAEFFLKTFSIKRGRPPKELSPEVEDLFLNYHWPGNVRELKNLIERLVILSDPGSHVISLKDLPEEMLTLPLDGEGTVTPNSLDAKLANKELELITEALERCGDNKTQAAKELGISRFSLLRRLQRHGLS
ncbi:response regulator with CheY-like receiver, AAA-type ATPase, and DNA-binding domains [Thermanaerovibrio velox DSM 12556]|uniref:Response regulator with CheY-like receiver, AAA-type ATPase, and DNA-binding domains n=1 Tax=Thermanaerovibrio velox DSM 12556 TaxID=926567 RepID=H0USC0_9BACT|nr:sigma-54 dependent transcriptional regulator [Thermanaerovibrio velox]EHM10209.1 response regulator with CheY-like receiver, AAA-type ATPase, and DNA-binding domains [Thermanaerovibrio velox DSM 12556]